MVAAVTLRFVSEDDPLSRLIKVLSPLVSHAEFVTPDGYALGARYEGGVQKRPLDYASFTTEIHVEIPTAHADEVYAAAAAHIGEPYDWKAILGFVVEEDLHDPGHCICSAFCTEMLQANHVLHPSVFEPSETTPHDLLRMVEQLGVTKVLRQEA